MGGGRSVIIATLPVDVLVGTKDEFWSAAVLAASVYGAAIGIGLVNCFYALNILRTRVSGGT